MKTPKTLNELLKQKASTQNSLSLYQQKSEKFLQIQAILADLLPVNMAQNLLVSNYKNSIIYFETHSAAVAASFKMHHSPLLSAFRRKLDPALVTIEIKVSPKSTTAGAKIKQVTREQANTTEKKAIPEGAAAMLEDIAQNSDPALRDKLLKLAKHKRRKD